MNQGARNGTRKGTQNVRKMTKRVKRSPDMNTRHKKTTGKHLEKIDIDNDKRLQNTWIERRIPIASGNQILYYAFIN
jgi:hypothetical protein